MEWLVGGQENEVHGGKSHVLGEALWGFSCYFNTTFPSLFVCVCVCVPLHGTEANDLLKEQALVFFKDRDRGLCLSTDALVRGRPQPHRPS